MLRSMKRMGMAIAVGSAAILLAVPPAQAQSPYFQVRPGLTVQQYAYNLATVGQALNAYPPGFFGNRLINSGAGARWPTANPYGSLSANPYAAATLANSAYGADPYSSSLYNNPYMGYGYADPYRGYLSGAADVINSQGKFMVSQQQAYLMKEQVREARINNKRRAFDEYLYEREKTPTAEEERQRSMMEQIQRSRSNPPITEIWSGKALNDLLKFSGN